MTYSSAHPINPNYGHGNGDGTFTIDVVATKMNGNTADPVPAGVVTGATLVYDYQPEPGTVAFTDVSIDDQPLSFN